MLWLEFKFGIEDKGFSAPNFFNDSVLRKDNVGSLISRTIRIDLLVRDITQTPILYSLVGTVNEQKV